MIEYFFENWFPRFRVWASSKFLHHSVSSQEQFNIDIVIINLRELIKRNSLWKLAGKSHFHQAPLWLQLQSWTEQHGGVGGFWTTETDWTPLSLSQLLWDIGGLPGMHGWDVAELGKNLGPGGGFLWFRALSGWGGWCWRSGLARRELGSVTTFSGTAQVSCLSACL